MTTTALFLYGTLRRVFAHELHVLVARHGEYEGNAFVRARLYDVGRYPGMVLSDYGTVVGELYRLGPAEWKNVICRLDALEGCSEFDAEPHEYIRVLVNAQLESGRTHSAWAYVFNWPIDGLVEIPSGDYVAWREAHVHR